jgi:hypothetical protein
MRIDVDDTEGFVKANLGCTTRFVYSEVKTVLACTTLKAAAGKV